MSKTVVTIIVGVVLSLGLLIGGFIVLGFFSYNQVKQEGTEMVETFAEEEVTEPTQTIEPAEPTEPVEPEVEETLDSLPNAEAEAAKWNETEPEFIESYTDFKMDASAIKKDEANSTDDESTFIHEFQNSVKLSIVYTVSNETKKITEMKLIGYEMPGADRASIFHAMSIFISYVDGEVTMEEGGEYLGEIPFATNEAGVYEKEFNGKKYEYILDIDEGTNTLVYRVGE